MKEKAGPDRPPEEEPNMPPEKPRTLVPGLLDVVALPEDDGAEEDALAVPEEPVEAALPPLPDDDEDEVVALWAQPRTDSIMQQTNVMIANLIAIFMESLLRNDAAA